MYLLFDIGATQMRLGISKDKRAVTVREIIETPRRFVDGMNFFSTFVRGVIGYKKIDAIAGGVACPLNAQKSEVLSAPHLPLWRGKPLKPALEKLGHCPVYIENDAALAALGEAHYGAGRGKRIMMYYTVSTGVGGARIVDGRIEEAHEGFEPGHQIITNDGKKLGYLESYVSGTGIMKRYGKHPKDVAEPQIWKEAAFMLALGLNNSIVHWSPEVIVLGGGMILHNRIRIEDVKKALKKMVKIYKSVPPIKKAALGELSGLYGALTYVNSKFQAPNSK